MFLGAGMDGGPPLSADQFNDRLRQIHDSLPRRLRQCADYAARHQARLAQATVADFARGAGVPASAVVRFSQVMGFSGYAQLRQLFRSPFEMPRTDYTQRLAELRSRGQGQSVQLLADFIGAARESLDRMADSIMPDRFEAAVQLLADADLVHTIGFGRCFPIAAQVAHGWDRMEVPQVLHGAAGDLPGLQAIRAGDALLLIATSPISDELRRLVTSLPRSDARLVAGCDPGVEMHLRHRAICLVLAEAEAAGFRTLASMMTLTLALAAAVAALRVPTGSDLTAVG